MNEIQLAQAISKIILNSNKLEYLSDAIKIVLPMLGTIVVSAIGYLTAKKTTEIGKEAQITIACKKIQHNLKPLIKRALHKLLLLRKTIMISCLLRRRVKS